MLTINRKVWYWRSSYTSDSSLIICFSQNILVSQILLCTFLLTYLPPLHTSNSISFPLLSHPLAIPRTPKTIIWLSRSNKKHGNNSLSFPISHIRLLYHKHTILIVHTLKYPQPLSHPPKSSLIFHLCPIFFMKLPRLPRLFIFHCTGFPTHSVGIQLPSHAIHHLNINYIVTFTFDLYTEFFLQLENSKLKLSVFFTAT